MRQHQQQGGGRQRDDGRDEGAVRHEGEGGEERDRDQQDLAEHDIPSLRRIQDAVTQQDPDHGDAGEHGGAYDHRQPESQRRAELGDRALALRRDGVGQGRDQDDGGQPDGDDRAGSEPPAVGGRDQIRADASDATAEAGERSHDRYSLALSIAARSILTPSRMPSSSSLP